MGPLLPSYNRRSLHSAEIHRARTLTLLARQKISGRPYGHESDRSIAMTWLLFGIILGCLATSLSFLLWRRREKGAVLTALQELRGRRWCCKYLCLAKSLSVPENQQFCTISSISRFAMTMVHVQLRPAEFGTGGPMLSFASQTTSGESGASPATRGTEA